MITLGPFYAEDAHESKDLIVTLNILILIRFPSTVEKGDSITSEGKGDYMFVDGVVKDPSLRGNSIPIQLKMVHLSSVKWCERLFFFFLTVTAKFSLSI